jgi:hypothetical protein
MNYPADLTLVFAQAADPHPGRRAEPKARAKASGVRVGSRASAAAAGGGLGTS